MSWKSVVADILPPVVTRGLKKAMGRDEAPTSGTPDLWPFATDAIGSFSQYGEDLVMDAALGCPASGTYVDIGANDPVVFNNTKRFYLRGWRGVSVEPNPTTFARLAADRPEDVNIQAGVGSVAGEMVYYAIDPDTLGTFDPQAAQDNLRDYPGARIVEELPVPIVTMASLLDENLAPGTRIDFMSLDVEGRETDVLNSNDWARWRPCLILVEVNRSGDTIIETLEGLGYQFAWFNGTNGLFVDGSPLPTTGS